MHHAPGPAYTVDSSAAHQQHVSEELRHNTASVQTAVFTGMDSVLSPSHHQSANMDSAHSHGTPSRQCERSANHYRCWQPSRRRCQRLRAGEEPAAQTEGADEAEAPPDDEEDLTPDEVDARLREAGFSQVRGIATTARGQDAWFSA